MSATPQRFEGSSIEEVLGRVRAELGHDAAIIEANKIRSGGLGGFFAKETFEVMATPVSGPGALSARGLMAGGLPVGGAATGGRKGLSAGRTVGPALQQRAPSGAPTAAGGPLSLLDMAERVSAAETADAADVTAPIPVIDGATPPPRMSRAQQVAEQVMAEHLRRVGGDGPAPSSPSTDASAFEPFRPAEMPRISTEGSAFTEVLQRIATDAGHEISQAVDAAGPDLTQGMASDMASAMAAPARPLMPAPAPASPSAPASAMVDELHPSPATSEVALHGRVALHEEIAPVTDIAPFEQPSPMEQIAPSEQIAEEDVADLAPQDDLPVARETVEQTMSRTERLLSWLELDHLPRTTLMSALRTLPQMDDLPATRGVVVAVVGERRRALKLCRQLARAWDSDPREVVLASATYRGSSIPDERRIIDLTDAANDRRGWRRRTAPTFVAVDCSSSLDPQAQTWTREVIEALDAHQVIGIVPAARKAEDVRRWADVVGGVDGLALDELAETTTPYAVLSLEIPVAFLADEPATPAAWTQLLLERTAA